MPAPKVLPPDSELVRLAEAGLTHAEIAEHIALTTGHRVSRSSVSVALSRAGYSKQGARYADALPWKVKTEHSNAYPARMLRLYAKSQRGHSLTEEEVKRLSSWLNELLDEDIVVGYCPEVGFLYVPADEIGDRPNDYPIRPRTISEEELA